MEHRSSNSRLPSRSVSSDLQTNRRKIHGNKWSNSVVPFYLCSQKCTKNASKCDTPAMENKRPNSVVSSYLCSQKCTKHASKSDTPCVGTAAKRIRFLSVASLARLFPSSPSPKTPQCNTPKTHQTRIKNKRRNLLRFSCIPTRCGLVVVVVVVVVVAPARFMLFSQNAQLYPPRSVSISYLCSCPPAGSSRVSANPPDRQTALRHSANRR